MMIVVDASVAIKWFVDEPLHPEARHICKYQFGIQAPDIILVEVANVAWKKTQQKEIKSEQVFGIIALAVDKRFFNKIKDTRFGKRIRFLDDPDLALPLYISLHKIDEIINLFGRIEGTYQNPVHNLNDESKRTFCFYNTSELQPLFDSPAYRCLNAEIEKLSAVEQADILALGWLGCGHDGGDWAPIRERAETMIKGNYKRFLRNVGSKAIYVEQGLAALRAPP